MCGFVCCCSLAPEFLQGTKPGAEFDTDEAPLIVFINARSGGRVGPELAGVLAKAVGSSQVRRMSLQWQQQGGSRAVAGRQQGSDRAAAGQLQARALVHLAIKLVQ